MNEIILSFSKRNDRLKICKECEHNFAGVCKECGCILRMKTFLANQSCPLEKWKAFTDSQTEDKIESKEI